MFCGGYGDAGGKMSEPDRCFNLILPLPSRSPGPIGFDNDLLLQDLRVGIKCLLSRIWILSQVQMPTFKRLN